MPSRDPILDALGPRLMTVGEVAERTRRGSATAATVAAEYGISRWTVYGIWQGRAWGPRRAA